MDEIMLVTTNYVPGKTITKVIGPIWGITVRSRGLGGNIMAGLRSLGGEKLKNTLRCSQMQGPRHSQG